jgi:hypothetical protein
MLLHRRAVGDQKPAFTAGRDTNQPKSGEGRASRGYDSFWAVSDSQPLPSLNNYRGLAICAHSPHGECVACDRSAWQPSWFTVSVRPDEDKAEELLQKLIVLQMFALGASQDKIAKVVGRQKLWVNTILKGLPPRPKSVSGASK